MWRKPTTVIASSPRTSWHTTMTRRQFWLDIARKAENPRTNGYPCHYFLREFKGLCTLIENSRVSVDKQESFTDELHMMMKGRKIWGGYFWPTLGTDNGDRILGAYFMAYYK
jgi:hypothetical protein